MAPARVTRRAWSSWLHDIGDFQSRALLTVFYFTVLAPFGFLLRMTSDPLALRRPQTQTRWIPAPPRETTIDSARRQY